MGVQVPALEAAILRGGGRGGPLYSLGSLCRSSVQKTAEPIKIPFVEFGLGWVQGTMWAAHWGYLRNTTESSMCGGDAAYFKLL